MTLAQRKNDDMIYEWLPDNGKGFQNFGDAMGEIVIDAMPNFVEHQNNLYFPIGSVIGDDYIKKANYLGLNPVFMGCGWYGKELSPELMRQAEFLGVRGPQTQSALERAGVFSVRVTGDSAYRALKYLDVEPNNNGKSIFVPHVSEIDEVLGKKLALGADTIVTPKVRGRYDTIETIKKISRANFVLAGSMHAAITAHYFGIPFAPASPYTAGGNFETLAPKWLDWFASIGVSAYSVRASRSVRDGQLWWDRLTDSYDLQPQFAI